MKKLLLTMIVSFVLCGTMFAQTYSTHWPDFDYHQYADNKGLVAYVKVDGQFADADTYQRYEVAAFVGNECRGTSFLKDETGLNDVYPAFQMQVYYDAQEGQEQLSFKLYDHVDSVEYSSCTPKFFSTGVATTLYTDNWYLGVWGEPDSNQAIVLDFVSPVTQTIALVAGTNWVSFYVDTDLDKLKAALVAAVSTSNPTIQISSQTQNVKYQRGRWAGQLAALNLAETYMIEVPEACEIVLEDMPVDPSTLSISINGGGNTWIAFPYNTEMTLANCFSGFAINNDQVQSQTANAKYNRGRWVGGFSSLEPGKGYIYISANPNDRTFAFPTSAKAF